MVLKAEKSKIKALAESMFHEGPHLDNHLFAVTSHEGVRDFFGVSFILFYFILFVCLFVCLLYWGDIG